MKEMVGREQRKGHKQGQEIESQIQTETVGKQFKKETSCSVYHAFRQA